jgi:hypothetical protein
MPCSKSKGMLRASSVSWNALCPHVNHVKIPLSTSVVCKDVKLMRLYSAMRQRRSAAAVPGQTRSADIETGRTSCSETRPTLPRSVPKTPGEGVPSRSSTLLVKAALHVGLQQAAIKGILRKISKHAPMTVALVSHPVRHMARATLISTT